MSNDALLGFYVPSAVFVVACSYQSFVLVFVFVCSCLTEVFFFLFFFLLVTLALVIGFVMYSEHADVLFLLFVFILCCFVLFICCCFCRFVKYFSVTFFFFLSFFFSFSFICTRFVLRLLNFIWLFIWGWGWMGVDGGGGGAGVDTFKPLAQSLHDKLWISSHILFTGEL